MRKTFFILIFTFVFGSYVQAQQQITVGINQQKTAVKNKLTIKFVALVEDSRCPAGTTCIWAGNARIKVSVKQTGAPAETFEMNTNLGATGASYKGFAIYLTDLTAAPNADARSKRGVYTATFSISRLTR